MPIEQLRFKPKLLVSTLEDDSEYQAFVSEGGQGLRFVPDARSPGDPATLTSDFGDFAKWVRQQSPSLRISVPADAPKLVLRSADVWLPLVYLASDTSLQLFLNMAASYLYDKAKGALKNDQARIHMSAIYHDKQAGKTKKFEFSGDADALAKAIKKFDLNNFFDDGAP
jgi:hypothetical protein